MPANRVNARQLLQEFNFKTLFTEEMGWGSVPNTRPVPMEVEGARFMRRLISQMSGVSVFEIYPADPKAKLPDAKIRAAIHGQIEKLSHENLLIFLDDDQRRTQSLWYWVKRDGKKKQAREHLYLQNQPGDLFLSKLDGLVIELNDLRADGTIPITEVTSRLADSLDVERVTKKFYNEFSSLRVDFINLIQGIDKDSDRFWYASVLLNRLMFIYFLQKRGFIQNNTRYLDLHLEASKQRGKDRYYSEFLQALFFEGFAKPADQRSDVAKQLLGEIKYLNGGLFLRHKLEDPENYPNITIPDKAFENVLKLFGSYSWHLDDTPGAADNEINPDVLGYIFEKYINQKAFGAYYTRPEVTQYLCERTIHTIILDRIHEYSTRKFSDLNEVLVKLDADLCRLLLLTVLPKISILDPACGSGAFLVAAMKTLLNIYAAIYGKIRFLNDTNLSARLKKIDDDHPSINYYVRKQIITNNLYGVDIMEEAAEIAKLRLFLVLVSSAQKVEDLEPLPNIDFNILTGNSLIGLLKVDDKRFDPTAHMEDMYQLEKAEEYRRVLAEKNRLIDLYRKSSSFTENLQDLRKKIDDYKREAYETLDPILLDDFGTLGIKYEQAQPTGKAIKRPLKPSDIEDLKPFHWGYEFDEIIETNGGFDVIIANPPWEIFKPQAKEFFAEYNDLVTKKKMTIKAFEEQQSIMLKEPDIQSAWLEYQSKFPYVSAYYRSAPQYKNQISVVNGKKAGTDINLYKLFTEQCINLLRKGGQMGIVIPSGIYTDLGTKQLRELLFSQTTITGLFGFENRKTIFEGVDSRFKFVVLTLSNKGSTTEFPAAFMRHDVQELEHFPSLDSLVMRVETIRKMSPDSLSIPEYKQALDLQIAEKMNRFPLLGETLPDTWNLKLGTEFHMTNDSDLFYTEPASGRLPLYEGKMIWQFEHQYAKPRYWVDEKEGRKRVLGKRGNDTGQTLGYQTYRLGFRDIASNTNERTLISTVTPKSFHGNKLPCLITRDENDNQLVDNITQLFICGVWNSFVIDYQIRQRVTTTLNFFYIYQLPIPRFSHNDQFFDAIVERVAKLICTTPEFDDLAVEVGLGSHQAGVTNEVQRARLRAELDGMIAHIYGLTEEEFAYILSTFPLVSEPVKVAAQNAYRDVERGLIN
jgi:hypothetical protein